MDRQRLLRAVGLFGLLVAVYFLTYTGDPVSTDELLMFDGAHSFLHGRSLELAYTSEFRPYSTPPGYAPVIGLDTEPMQAFVATPLLWLAEHIPGIGMMQLAWTLNIFATALTAVVLYYYGVVLGYRDRAAILTALAFGLATYAWPYSKMFFREPLFTLLILICAYGLERWRQQIEGIEGQRFRLSSFVGWLVLALLTLVLAMLTKQTSLLVAPVLILVALPGRVRRLLNWRIVAVVILVLAGIGLFAQVYQQSFSGNRYNILARLGIIDLSYVPLALPAYLISPGFSIWAFSPVLLLGFAGFYSLLRQGRLRQALVPLTFLLSLALGYSIFQGSNWYGGTGWGPRYLLPVVPFLALWLLPIADAILTRGLAAWKQAVIVGVGALSIFVQVIGVTVSLQEFPGYLYAEGVALGHSLAPWQAGVWNPLYNPIFVLAHRINSPSPIAWVLNGTGAIVIPLCLITIGTGVVVLVRRCTSWRGFGLSAAAVGVSLAATCLLGLGSYYHDLRFRGNDTILWQILDKLNVGMQSGDAVLLNDNYFVRFLMNYYKRPEPIYAMLDAPGERLGDNASPEIVTANPELQAHTYDAVMLPRLAATTSRWWYITEMGPYSKDRLRPTEHYLVRHYFPAQELVTDVSARLITFAPINAPPDSVPPWPEHKVGTDFGSATLVGYDLPLGDAVRAGTLLPISLLWRHDGWPADLSPFDYSINVSLINHEGATVAQRAMPPLSTFAPMSTWVKGGYYRDNHALELPPNLPAGDYTLWVLVYDWSRNTNLPVRNAAPNAPADHMVLGTIHIGN
ncbi:MAG: hypothetical protein ABI947_26260 [Chloroflexota bacterium]